MSGLSGLPHTHDAGGARRAPDDTGMTLLRPFGPKCLCTDAHPDNRPTNSRRDDPLSQQEILDVIARALRTMAYDEPSFVLSGQRSSSTVEDYAMAVWQALGGRQSVLLRCADCEDEPLEDCPVHGRSYAEVWRLLSESQASLVKAQDVLRLLVALKDGPRDERYAELKPGAWDKAREVVGPWRLADPLVPGVNARYILVGGPSSG